MISEMIKILCVDDERNVLKALRRLFMDEDNYEILIAESGEEGIAQLEDEPGIRLVISDYRMPGMTGVEFLAKVCEKWPDTIRIVLSGYADTAAVVEAINLGQIYKFIPKPWIDEELKTVVSTALEHQNLLLQNNRLNEELQRKNKELQNINEKLEHIVEERTVALEVRNRVLQISQGILDVLSVAVLGIDLEGMIVQCNERAQALFPHGQTGPLGNNRRDVLPAEINQFLDESGNSGQTLRREVVLNGTRFWLETKNLPEQTTRGMILEFIPQG